MTTEAPTIAQTVQEIRAALRDYIEATYHVGHPFVIEQRRQLLEAEGVIYREPFIESTPRYRTDRRFAELELRSPQQGADQQRPGIQDLFNSLTSESERLDPLLFDPPYTHQADSLEFASRDGSSLAITTGTGSGKTESFLLPMLAKLGVEASEHPDSFALPAVRAMILYPMNALVNDQLGRLRLLLGDPRVTGQFHEWAGRPARFARYTSRTLYPGVRTRDRDGRRLRPIDDFYVDIHDRAEDPSALWHVEACELRDKLAARGKWPAKPDIRAWWGARDSRWLNREGNFQRAVTLPNDPELLTRHEVLAAPPDVLITNYSMLEYMLMRPLERPLFDFTRQWLAENEEETFLLIVDEAHLYRGSAGAEVALLLRRLRTRLGISPERLQVITTSASFSDAEHARDFAAQLSGKNVADFRTIEGKRKYREPESEGTPADAEILSSVPLQMYYDANDEAAKREAVSSFLNLRGVNVGERGSAELLYEALHNYGPMNLLVNATMRKAQPVSELGRILFPGAEPDLADRAVTTLAALGSAAREKPEDAGLFPCRVHGFFRGLPGLWACIDPSCSELDEHLRGGPIGRLYAQPRATCDCGARVFEFYTCRHCGTSYVRAYTDNVLEPGFLWHERGGAFQAAAGSVQELQALDLLLEQPTGDGQRADIDLITGALDPERLGTRHRLVFIPTNRGGQTVESANEDDEPEDVEANGEFRPCGVCGRHAGFGRSSVQDHQTKGDQPFQAIITRQIEIQPPSKDYSDFAPLRGRKVLAFSDSRQVAARLAPNLQNYSMRDVIRPLIIRGWTELESQQLIRNRLSLQNMFLATMVGATILKVRLRPELRGAESMEVMREVAAAVEGGAFANDNHDELIGLVMLQDEPPLALLKAMYATLTDRYYGLTSLGLASLRETGVKTGRLLTDLPTIAGVAETDEEKLALLRLWLGFWTTKGIWFSAMQEGEWWNVSRGVLPHSGRFGNLGKWLPDTASRRQFHDAWLPVLLHEFCEAKDGRFRLLARNVALETGGEWGYCERCRFTQRPFPGQTRCVSCRTDNVRVLDPNTDEVFQARKGYYRASTTRALEDDRTPMSIIAREHTAQLNSAQSDEVFSRAEQYELLFQDVSITLPNQADREQPAIDVLSCTTTMEVGIDIGSLSGVALRNMPPSRANYQQRAGRAGRRGNAVATVVAFGSADTHDDQYFRDPAAMIRGDVDDPALTMDNDEIARRHVTAYLLQRYHQDRLPDIDPEAQPQLFEVLGTVSAFVGTETPLNRIDFEGWLHANEQVLAQEVAGWLPDELGSGRSTILSGLVSDTLKAIDKALRLEADGGMPKPDEGEDAPQNTTVEPDTPAEDGAELPSEVRAETNLLDRLLYEGVLPRYAFPTDVVTFHVFDEGRSERFRTEFRYEPSQGLNVALSQYAPGKVVWLDNREWTSGAIYSPMPGDRSQAWSERWLYFECPVCHYAIHIPGDEAEVRSERECAACGSQMNPAMNWMRPPGFAHRAYTDPGTSPDDAPAISYATRAKLVAEGPQQEGEWTPVTDRLSQSYDRHTLLVTNTGPRDEGYSYCVRCGLIEPTHNQSGALAGPHPKPYPHRDRECRGSASTRGLVLGTDFKSDVLLVRLRVDEPVRLMPGRLATDVALRTIAEALTIAATQKLDVEATELQAEYRPALTPLGHRGLESEIYLYDTLAGGAGFTRRVFDFGEEVFRSALARLEHCPVDCDESCYRCLRSFRNRFEHGLLDRRIGASLLRYLLNGDVPRLDQVRLDSSADKLFADLQSRGLEHVNLVRNATVDVPGIGVVLAPILATSGDYQLIIGVHGPLTLDAAPNPGLHAAKEYGVPVKLLDDIIINRNLPFATNDVIQRLS